MNKIFMITEMISFSQAVTHHWDYMYSAFQIRGCNIHFIEIKVKQKSYL